MTYFGRILCIWILAVVVAGQAAAATITVTGTGQAEAAPDTAVLTLGVWARALTAKEASAQMGADLTQVIESLRRQSVPDTAIQTQGLSLSPVYEQRGVNRRSEVVGFEASSTLAVTIAGLDQVGRVLDAVISNSANRLQNISFSVADPAPLLRMARQAAIADARARAEIYAGAAGVELGDIVEIRESGGGGGPRPEMMMSARMSADVPVMGGEVGYSASVTVIYDLKVGD